MNILILGAGYGTRLYPLTENLPKPLLSINDRPIIDFLIDKIKGLEKDFSVEDVKVISNNKFYEQFINWKERGRLDIEIVNDGSNSPQDRLGSIGDMQLGMHGEKGDWLVLGGDNLFEDDLTSFLKLGYEKKPYPLVGLYDVGDRSLASRYGVVKVSPLMKIIELAEKPKFPGSTLIATCVYFFPEQTLKLLSQYASECQTCDTSGDYIRWLLGKTEVFGYSLKGKWMDIGRYDSLRKAEKVF